MGGIGCRMAIIVGMHNRSCRFNLIFDPQHRCLHPPSANISFWCPGPEVDYLGPLMELDRNETNWRIHIGLSRCQFNFISRAVITFFKLMLYPQPRCDLIQIRRPQGPPSGRRSSRNTFGWRMSPPQPCSSAVHRANSSIKSNRGSDTRPS